jgi:predicted Zn-dependent protease with MMP-like domain
MNRRRFEQVVDRVLDGLPPSVVEKIDNLVVLVEERPTEEQDPEGSLLGLYEGTSLLERSGDYWGALPDRIIIFRLPHLEMGLAGHELEKEIRRTVLHEIGHYLGLEDSRLHELGWD